MEGRVFGWANHRRVSSRGVHDKPLSQTMNASGPRIPDACSSQTFACSWRSMMGMKERNNGGDARVARAIAHARCGLLAPVQTQRSVRVLIVILIVGSESSADSGNVATQATAGQIVLPHGDLMR